MQRSLVLLALAAAASAFTAPAMTGHMQLRSSKAGESPLFCNAVQTHASPFADRLKVMQCCCGKWQL